ncbi:MAG TPA: peptidoglycan DD-metalloendopeptidase family protein [Rhodanobacteraceae bacterium]|nr:peptidoglycan DD-metalloendopeptidase family protein [Rhodanobacteraceae bacterium]
MRSTVFLKSLLACAFTAALAGCASTPAPVVNHSFGVGAEPPSSPPPAPSSAHGTQTFGLGGHANGTVGRAGYTVAPGDTMYSIAFAHGLDVRQLAALNGIQAPYVIHPGQVLKLKPSDNVAAAPATMVPGATGAPPAAPAPTGPVFGPITTQTLTATGVAPASAASAPAVATSATPAASSTAPIPGATTTTPPTAAPIAAAPAATAAVASAAASAPAVATPPPGATRNVAGITWQWPASGKIVGGFKAGSGGDGAGVDIAGSVGDPVRAAAAGTVVYSGNGLIGYGELVIIKHNDTYLSAYGHNSKRLVSEGQHVAAGQEIALMGASGAPRVELHFEIRQDGKPVDPLNYLPQR